MSGIEMDAGTFAAIIREQKGLPITAAEAKAIARALDTCHDDEEFLATMLSAVRLLADRLEQPEDDESYTRDTRGPKPTQPEAAETTVQIFPPLVVEAELLE